MDMKLLVIAVPVSDVDVAKDFYERGVGFGSTTTSRRAGHEGGPADASGLAVLGGHRAGAAAG